MRYRIYIALSTLVCLFLAFPASAQRGGNGGGGGVSSSSSGASSSGGGGGGGSVSARPSGGGGMSPQPASSGNAGTRPSFGGGGSAGVRPSFGGGGNAGNSGGNIGVRPSFGGGGMRPQAGSFQGVTSSPARGHVYVDRQGNIIRGQNGYNSAVGVSARGNYGMAPRTGVVAGGMSTRGPVGGGVSSYRTVPQIGYGHGGYWGDHGYYYNNRGYYGSYYSPRLGFACAVLPYGYYPFYYGDYQYYFSDGLFYTYDNSSYTVVEPPIGAEITVLPNKAQSIVINGQQYYELNGVYYQPVTKDDGTIVYMVAGKDGELNTNSADYQQSQGPQIGDIVSQLPQDCRKIKVNGSRLFVSPDGVYYQQVVDANGNISFKIVGLPSDEPEQN
ncbi:MAG: hypothetical protein JWP44_4646 [Mucilaginibacter sp.]|nr:hypothetical protein [Mucilaginibacter sp.]